MLVIQFLEVVALTRDGRVKSFHCYSVQGDLAVRKQDVSQTPPREYYWTAVREKDGRGAKDAFANQLRGGVLGLWPHEPWPK